MSVLLVRFSIAGLILLPVTLIVLKPSELPSAFWRDLALCIPLELMAMWLYVHAIRDAPLHLTLPYLAFTPVFNIVTAYWILGETISAQGFIGIMLIVAGAYLLNIEHINQHSGRNILAPIRAIFKLRGSVYMLITAAIYSMTAVISKRAMVHMEPETFGAVYFTAVGFSVLLLVALTQRSSIPMAIRQPRIAIVVGLLMTIMVVTHFIAIAQIEVAYMVSVKRTSLLFGIIYSIYFFKEASLKQHFTAGSIMFIGVVLIIL